MLCNSNSPRKTRGENKEATKSRCYCYSDFTDWNRVECETMRKTDNSESEEEIQNVDEAVEQFQTLERIVSPENEPSKAELEELNLEKMKIEEREHKPEINEDDPEEITEANPEATDDTNTCTENGVEAKASIYGDIETEKEPNDDDDFGDFDDAFNTAGEDKSKGVVLEDDFGGFGEATANPSVEFNASFGEHANANQPQEDGDDDDFGDFGETNEAGDDDFGDFGGDDDFGDFSQTVVPPPPVLEVVNDLEPVSLGPVWEELKAATSYEQEEPEKTQYAWEERQESIDKLNDFLNASALDLTWNSSATKKMFEYIMPKFLQLTRDVEKEREAELEKIRKEKEEQSAMKNAMSNGAKNLLAQLADLSYLNP